MLDACTNLEAVSSVAPRSGFVVYSQSRSDAVHESYTSLSKKKTTSIPPWTFNSRSPPSAHFFSIILPQDNNSIDWLTVFVGLAHEKPVSRFIGLLIARTLLRPQHQTHNPDSALCVQMRTHSTGILTRKQSIHSAPLNRHLSRTSLVAGNCALAPEWRFADYNYLNEFRMLMRICIICDATLERDAKVTSPVTPDLPYPGEGLFCRWVPRTYGEHLTLNAIL